MPRHVRWPAHEFRHSGLDPESSIKLAKAMFQTALDTGFRRYDV
jgi:hypothetical protein